jgi:pimeloyl-ACP methyl ester carboxylesterase
VALDAARATDSAVRLISVKPTDDVRRSDFRVWHESAVAPRAVLVLVPGQNGDGAELFVAAEWKRFAAKYHLALVVPHFVSDDAVLLAGRGYFAESRASGALLESALEQCGWRDVPLLLYGYSGGAHFAMSFAAWRPDRVAAFCAYSFAWWSPPPSALTCPALVACGQADGTRYGASYAYFQAGRRMGKPWGWVSLEAVAHTTSPELDAFVRETFACVLGSQARRDVVVDNVTEELLKDAPCDAITVSVLPCEDLLSAWQKLHHP